MGAVDPRRALTIALALTKAEHDELVERTGRPATQDPIQRRTPQRQEPA